MKRFLAMVMVSVMVFALVACGAKNDGENTGNTGNNASGENIESPVALLTAVWDSYGDDEKFMAMGGGGASEVVDAAPGEFSVSDAATVYSMLAMPTDTVAKVDSAASLFNAMMLNNFSAGAFHVAKSGDVASVADDMKKGITGMQWMCGFPEKYIVVTVDDYVVSAYGLGEFIDTFKAKLTALYPSANVVYEGDVM